MQIVLNKQMPSQLVLLVLHVLSVIGRCRLIYTWRHRAQSEIQISIVLQNGDCQHTHTHTHTHTERDIFDVDRPRTEQDTNHVVLFPVIFPVVFLRWLLLLPLLLPVLQVCHLMMMIISW